MVKFLRLINIIQPYAETPVIIPSATVATAASSEVITQSAVSRLTLLYKPPRNPTTEIFLVSLTANCAIAGVALQLNL